MKHLIWTRDNEVSADVFTGQLLLFGLLGKLLYENPEENSLRRLVHEEVFSDVPFAGSRESVQEGLALLKEWATTFANDAAGTTLDLKADYTRLFVGTVQLPLSPWESVYYSEERLLFQESTMDVRRWYQRFGLEPINLRKEPDDHIGLELAFIAHLARHALNALESGDNEALETLIGAQRDFSRKHLMVWAPIWCEQMVEHAYTPFYRGLALILRGALDEMAELLDLPTPEVQIA